MIIRTKEMVSVVVDHVYKHVHDVHIYKCAAVRKQAERRDIHDNFDSRRWGIIWRYVADKDVL